MNGQSCENWRLIVDSPLTGPRNMARDEVLLRAAGAGDAPPTLRLYAWNPPALSLGFGQRVRDADLERLTARGWGLVRRLTGGRAILHTEELTYSVTLPGGHPLAQGNVVESYRRISAALAGMAWALGADTRAEPAEAGQGVGSAVCFETPSHYELTVNGRKLVGSAQARRFGGLLQHGAIPLSGDPGRIADGLAFADDVAREEARISVRVRAVTLSEAVGRLVAWSEAADALCSAVERAFEVRLQAGPLTPAEQDAASAIESSVYGAWSWTARR